MYGTQISFGAIPDPETAYWVPACAHTLPQEGDGNCKVPPAVNPMQDLPESFGCRRMGCTGSGSTADNGCAAACTAAGNCDTEGYGSHAAGCTLVGYWPLEGNGNDRGPQGNALSPSWETADHLTNVVYNAGYRGLAYYGAEGQSLQIIDRGEADFPFDLQLITMAAWLMPTAHTIADEGVGYHNQAIIFNKEDSYEIALNSETGGTGAAGLLIGAFKSEAGTGAGCWRWWGGSGVAPVGEWTHVIGGVDGDVEFHYINGAMDGTAACPMGSLRQNDFPFKLGARARGTGMDNARGSGFAGEGGNDVAVAYSGSRFYGEIDEAMIFSIGVDADQASAIYNLFTKGISCDTELNLSDDAGVVATCTGCDRHSNDDVGGAAVTIDGDHSPGTWTSAPHSTQPTCATQAYVTIDLGEPRSLTGVTIWHYYGNSRAYCSQKLAISDSGAFAGEEVVVYDTGTCSGWCSFPIVCDGGTSGDCTPDNYGPTETADGNIFTWAPQSGQYVRHWSSRGQNAGVHFMEIDVYGC